MAEFMDNDQTDEFLDFDGRPYLFEPEYTEEELQEQDERRRAMEGQTEDQCRRARTLWCVCGYCEPMDTKAECLCCQESDLFHVVMDGIDLERRCVTAIEDFPYLLNRAVLDTFFHVPKINWRRRQLSKEPLVHQRVVIIPQWQPVKHLWVVLLHFFVQPGKEQTRTIFTPK